MSLIGAAYAAAGGWSTSVSLSTPIEPTLNTSSPTSAINSSGAQVAAWINEGNDLLLQVAARDAGASWSAAQTLTPAAGFNASDPAVAIDPAGTAVAIWSLYQINPPNQLVIQASTRPAHGVWGPVVTVSSTSGSSTVPKVAMDSSGNAVAIWMQNGIVESATLPAFGSWTAPVALSASGISASSPALAVNASGIAIAGWQTSRGQILVAERHSAVWGAPATIAAPAFRAGTPSVAINGTGAAAIAWSGRGTTLVATRPAGGSWSTPTTVSTQSEGGTARIALDDSGNAVAAFAMVRNSGASYPVQVVTRLAGGTWSTPTTISAVADYSTSVGLVATPAGSFIAGWVDDTTFTVRAAIRSAGQSVFSAPVALGGGRELDLSAASGHVIASWIGSGPSVDVSTNAIP
jgi:hypothetical protein